MNEPFPEIRIDGGQIRPKDHVEPGTGLAVFAAFCLAAFGIAVTCGIGLIGLPLYPLFAWYLHKKALAMIHGSGVLVGEDQFPQIHDCIMTFKQRLGVTKNVSIYIVEAKVINAFTVKYGKKNVILLTDDLIHGCLASHNPPVLSFIIAHELAHIALNHNSVFRSWMAQQLKRLGRLDEYTADSVAAALVGDKSLAYTGLLLLTIGYALLPYVNPASIVAQAREVAENKYSKKAEKVLPHPLLLNRLYRVLQR